MYLVFKIKQIEAIFLNQVTTFGLLDDQFFIGIFHASC